VNRLRNAEAFNEQTQQQIKQRCCTLHSHRSWSWHSARSNTRGQQSVRQSSDTCFQCLRGEVRRLTGHTARLDDISKRSLRHQFIIQCTLYYLPSRPRQVAQVQANNVRMLPG
jgi:hypothetical protein